MSVAIQLNFLAGRFHATPWGRHVNEGVPEWPPSPWRILRALIAVWKRTCPDLPEADVRPVVEALLTAPSFRLPEHRVAHTRHYMPWEQKGPDDRTLIFDTFTSLRRGDPLTVVWPETTLDEGQTRILAQLVGNLTTLGRAESWVEAQLLQHPVHTNCEPSASEHDPVQVLCADPISALAGDFYPVLDPKKLAAGKIRPSDYLLDSPPWHLCLDTETIHEERWSSVPGSRWVGYQRPAETPVREKSPSRRERERPTVVLFILDGPVLPLVTETLAIGDQFRRAVLSCFESWCKDQCDDPEPYRRKDDPRRFASPTLSGKTLGGAMRSDHQHAHYIPMAEGSRLSYVNVYAREGFGEAELAALTVLRKMPWTNGRKLQVRCVGVGKPSDFTSEIFATSHRWRSISPFLGHARIGIKGQARDLRKCARREWRRLADLIPELHGVEIVNVTPLQHAGPEWAGPRPIEYRRVRYKDRFEGYRACGLFDIELSRPIQGPFALGYGSHFGLGLFTAGK